MNCSVAKTTRKVNTNRKNWDVDAQANIKQVTEDINEKVKLHDYYNVEWRNEAILHSAVFGAKIMDKVRRQNNKRINGSIKTFLKNSIKIDIYDKYGNFIETLNTLKQVKEKYKVPASKIKNIQCGDRYYKDWIFKYHSK